MSDYTVTIRRLDTVGDRCSPVPRPDTPCQGRASWTVAADSGQRGSGGSNVCADHLIATIKYWLGLPQA